MGGDAGLFENFGGFGAGGQHQRQQQIFGGDKAVAGLLGGLLGIVEQPGGFLRQIDLARSALHLGQLLERGFHAGPHGAIRAARCIDQPGRKPFLVIDQHLEQMLGHELLVALAQGQALCRLNKAAGPLGEFLDIHVRSRSAPL